MNYQLVNNSAINLTCKTIKVDNYVLRDFITTNYVIYIKVQQKCNILFFFFPKYKS